MIFINRLNTLSSAGMQFVMFPSCSQTLFYVVEEISANNSKRAAIVFIFNLLLVLNINVI